MKIDVKKLVPCIYTEVFTTDAYVSLINIYHKPPGNTLKKNEYKRKKGYRYSRFSVPKTYPTRCMIQLKKLTHSNSLKPMP